jgi:hypothetical protein
MPNSVVETTGETLNRLHTTMLATLMDQTKLFDYLLNSQVYLKTEDLAGWKKEYQPEPVIPKPPVKRLRQSPCTAPVIPMPMCNGCKTWNVIDDVEQGQHVCINCGLIQQHAVFTADSAHSSMSRLMNTARVCIHRYSRIVHFRTTIRLMQGDSNPQIDKETLSRMRAELDGNNKPSVDDVNVVLRKLGLARKYRRHRFTLTVLLGAPQIPLISAPIIFTMLKMFRRLEYYWGFHHKTIAPGRKVFFSYRFIFYQFAHELGYPELTGKHHLLKNSRLSAKLMEAYKRSCQYTGFTCFE